MSKIAQTLCSSLLITAVVACAPIGKHIRVDSSRGVFTEHDYDTQSLVLFNQSVEGLVLNALEKAMMSRIGLDPNDSDDYALLAFIVRGFHLRYYTRKSDKPKNDLGVYLYNLDGVRVGQSIPILDASTIEGARAPELGAILHRVFDPIRRSRKPHAIVAVSPGRSGESLWRRAFINAFAKKVYFAKAGTAVITEMSSGTSALARIAMPVKAITSLQLRVSALRDGRKWWIQPQDVKLEISGK